MCRNVVAMDLVHLGVAAYIHKGKLSVSRHHTVTFYTGIISTILLSLETLALGDDKWRSTLSIFF